MKQYHLFFAICFFILYGIILSCEHKTVSDPAVQQSDTTKVDSMASAPQKKKAAVASWKVNAPSSKIEFTVKNFGKDVHGTLTGLKATIHFDKNNLTGSSFDASIPVNSINTAIAKRDKDLMHEKYFNAEKYPEITFRSDSIVKTESGFMAIGPLTIKGKSIARKIPFTFDQNGESGTFKSHFTLNRHDYDFGGEGPIMGDDINVSLEVVTQKE